MFTDIVVGIADFIENLKVEIAQFDVVGFISDAFDLIMSSSWFWISAIFVIWFLSRLFSIMKAPTAETSRFGISMFLNAIMSPIKRLAHIKNSNKADTHEIIKGEE